MGMVVVQLGYWGLGSLPPPVCTGASPETLSPLLLPRICLSSGAFHITPDQSTSGAFFSLALEPKSPICLHDMQGSFLVMHFAFMTFNKHSPTVDYTWSVHCLPYIRTWNLWDPLGRDHLEREEKHLKQSSGKCPHLKDAKGERLLGGVQRGRKKVRERVAWQKPGQELVSCYCHPFMAGMPVLTCVQA